MPERKVNFLDALAFGAASTEQRKKMNEVYEAGKAKKEAKKGKDDESDKKSSKSKGSKSSSKSGKSKKSCKALSSMSTIPENAAPEARKSTASRSTKTTRRSKSTKSHQGSSTTGKPCRTASSYSRERSDIPLPPQPVPHRSVTAPVSAKPAHKRRTGFLKDLKAFAKKLFTNRFERSEDGRSVPSPSESFFHPRPRPTIPCPEDRDQYADPGYNHPNDVWRWLRAVNEDDPAQSGVALSNFTGEERSTVDGYPMGNYPLRSERGGSSVADFRRDNATISPDDGVSRASSRRARRGF